MTTKAPSITQDHVTGVLRHCQFHRFAGTTTTVCCITLANGATVVGKSACVSPENFNADKGQQLAYDDAKSKIFELEGYLLLEELHQDARQTNGEKLKAEEIEIEIDLEVSALDMDKLRFHARNKNVTIKGASDMPKPTYRCQAVYSPAECMGAHGSDRGEPCLGEVEFPPLNFEPSRTEMPLPADVIEKLRNLINDEEVVIEILGAKYRVLEVLSGSVVVSPWNVES